MIIKELLIKNYRCFGNYPTIIDFSGSGITPLIGPNNVGKSTVLKCLDLLLGDKWPMSRFEEDDFHNNKLENPIVIACSFSDSVFVQRDIKNRTEVKGLAITAKHLKTGVGESSINVDYRLLSEISNLGNEDWIIATYYSDKPIYISQEIKNQLPIVITIPLVKLSSEQPTNKWSILGRMLQKVEDSFRELDDGRKVTDFENKIKDAVAVLKEPSEFQGIETDIKNLWKEIRPSNIKETELTFLELEPWRYYRQFKIAIKRGNSPVPIDSLGEGVQRLAAIAIYRAYLRRHRRSGKPILLVEEPESYLHPQSRKVLFSALKLAVKQEEQSEGQVIYTTHSSDFMDFGEFEDIILLRQPSLDGRIDIRKIYPNKIRDHAVSLGIDKNLIREPKVYYKILESTTVGLKDALFSIKTLLAEGPSELELFQAFSDIEKHQIAIVSAGGKGSIPAVYAFLTAFGVPTLVVIDSDEAKGKNDTISKMLKIQVNDISSVSKGNTNVTGSLLIFGGNLEDILEKRLSNYKDLLAAIHHDFNLPSGDRRSKPSEIRAMGLLFKGEVNSETFQQSIELMKNEKENFQKLSEELNSFIKVVPIESK